MSLPAIPPYALEGRRPTNQTQWQLDPARSVLLIHDMQEHFVDVFDRSQDTQIDSAIDAISRLLATARAAGVPVVYTAQPPRQESADRQLLTDFWGPGLMSDEAATIVRELTPLPDETVLTKWRYSAFHRTDLLDRMRNRGHDQLVITGVYAHIGCLTTALEAFMHGIQSFFVTDAQADFSLNDHVMAQDYVAARCGQVIDHGEILNAFRTPVAVSARA